MKKINLFLIYPLICLGIICFISCRKKLDKITDNAIFVADEKGGTITVVDAENLETIRTIDLMDNGLGSHSKRMLMPHNVQVSPNGETIWVTGSPMTEDDEAQVIVINARRLNIKKRIKVGKDQHLAHVVLDSKSKYAYVTANEKNQVIKIDAEKFKEVARFDLGEGKAPHGLRYYDGKVYVANLEGHSVSIIDVESGNIEEISLGGVAVQTAISPNGSYIYVSLYDTKEIVRIDRITRLTTRIALPDDAQGPIQMYVTPDSKQLYVCDQGGLLGRATHNKVYVVDLNSFSVIKTIETGNKTHGVVIDNEGKYAYVTNSNDNTLSVIDILSQTVIATLPVGLEPNGVSCWHRHGETFAGKP